MSVALYVESENHIDYLYIFYLFCSIEKLRSKLSDRLHKDSRIDLSLLYAYDTTRVSHPYDLLYPINALRNLALTQCKSKYAFSLDVDFSVSQNTSEIINKYLHLLRDTESPLALVIPVFEWVFDREVMPNEFDIEKLRLYCSNGRLIPFHAKKRAKINFSKEDLQNWCFGKSLVQKHLKITRVQNLTDYTKWLSATNAYPISKNAKVLDSYYEPYFVARKELIPLFSERFRGCMINFLSN
jgi:hypothetical protein